MSRNIISTLSFINSKYIKAILKFSFAAFILWWLFATKRINFELLTNLDKSNLKWILCAFSILPFQGIIVSIRWYQLQRIRGFSLTINECIRLTFIGIFFSICLPGSASGDVVKMMIVAKDAPARKVEAGAIIILDRFLGIVSLILIAMAASIAMIILSPSSMLFYRVGFLLFLIICMILLLFYIIFNDRLFNIQWIVNLTNRFSFFRIIKRILFEIHSFKEHYWVLGSAFILSFIGHGIEIVSFYLVGRAINDSLGFVRYLIFTPIVFISNILPLTPGGIGVAESITSFLWKTYGAMLGANIMLIFRVLLVIMALALGLPSWLLWKKS